MKKFIIAIIFLLTAASIKPVAAQQYQYTFNNTLNEFSGGPALTETLACGAAAGGFSTNQTITTTSGTCGGTPTVFSFNRGAGLVFGNSPSFINGSYTIHSFFQFLPFSGGYGRIFDFSNSGSDAGIYVLNNCLNFYPSGNVGTCPYFVDGNYYLLSLVRDGVTNQIKIYVNGNVFSSYNDASGTYKPATTTTPIIFFRDDNPVPCETRAGNVKYISLSPAISSDAEVASLFANICTTIALPVTLVSFNVTKINSSNVYLTWKTSQEIDISTYVVERSNDGVNFQSIGQVNATASTNSVKEYHFNDAAPAKGINYYRIKIVDRNNINKYSAIKNIKNTGNAELTIFPSPVKDILKVKIDAESTAKGTLVISDASGRQLRSMAISISGGPNNFSFDVSNLTRGTYVLKMILNENSSVIKFTKL